jgi:tetratricopeptide (TPR) repeat protein
MAKVPYTAVNAAGKSVSGFVDESTMEAAVAHLKAQGLQDIELLVDPLYAAEPKLPSNASSSELAQIARIQKVFLRNPNLPTLLKAMVFEQRWWMLACFLIAAWAFYVGWQWIAVAIALLLLLPFVWTAFTFSSTRLYISVIREQATGQWDAALNAISQLRQKRIKDSMVAFDLDVRAAAILAKQYQLPQALDILKPWKEQLSISRPGLYESRLATVYYAAGNPNACVRFIEDALLLNPSNTTIKVDCALMNAMMGDRVRAQDLLNQLDRTNLPSFAPGFLSWIQAKIDMRNVNSPEALSHISKAIEAFLPMMSNPAIWSSVALCTADYALCLHRAGRTSDARQAVERVWSVLQPTADATLLATLGEADLLPRH